VVYVVPAILFDAIGAAKVDSLVLHNARQLLAEEDLRWLPETATPAEEVTAQQQLLDGRLERAEAEVRLSKPLQHNGWGIKKGKQGNL